MKNLKLFNNEEDAIDFYENRDEFGPGSWVMRLPSEGITVISGPDYNGFMWYTNAFKTLEYRINGTSYTTNESPVKITETLTDMSYMFGEK